MSELRNNIVALLFIVLFAQIGQAQLTHTPEGVVHDHYAQLLRAIERTPGLAAPVVARVFGYTGLCVHEVHGIYQSSQAPLNLPGFSKTGRSSALAVKGLEHVVMSTALSMLTDSLIVTLPKQDVIALHKMHRSVLEKSSNSDQSNQATALGKAIALQIWEYSKTDGGHRAELSNYDSNFKSPINPQYWQPQPDQVAVLPQWGKVRTFSEANEKLQLPMPFPFDTVVGSKFYLAAQEVAKYGSHCNIEQRQTAFYWFDGLGTKTPAGHSIGIARTILIAHDAKMDLVARTYASLGMALSDAMVACWRLKYAENLVRPIDYIRKYIDPNWQAAFLTPPFPEYPSGHCTQAGAAQFVLEQIFDDLGILVDSTFGRREAMRAYRSFEHLSTEISDSRLFGGVHYRFSNTKGAELGQKAAAKVVALFGPLAAEKKALKAVFKPDEQTIYFHGLQDQHLSAHVFTLGGTQLGIVSEVKPLLSLGKTQVDQVYISYKNTSGVQVSEQALPLYRDMSLGRVSIHTDSPHLKKQEEH
jgi:hypothetical protein